MIQLPYGGGGQFDENRLIQYIQTSGRNYIIQGQQPCTFAKHTKPQSLDYWLRQFANNPDTKQAVNQVVDDLVGTGLFIVVLKILCPDTGYMAKGLRLVNI